MTMATTDSEFGNSSSSSMASFMSGLLQENFSRLEIPPHQLKIDIVSDNAKNEMEIAPALNRCRSLVTMKRNKCSAAHRFSRWGTDKHHPPRQPLGAEKTNNKATMRQVSSETMLLRLPARQRSPEFTNRKHLVDQPKSHLMNAKWESKTYDEEDMISRFNPKEPRRQLKGGLSPTRPVRKTSTERQQHTQGLWDRSARTGLSMPMRRPSSSFDGTPQSASASSGLSMPIRLPSVQASPSCEPMLQSSRLVASVFKTSSKELADAIGIEAPTRCNTKRISTLNHDSFLSLGGTAGSALSSGGMTRRVHDAAALGVHMSNKTNQESRSLQAPITGFASMGAMSPRASTMKRSLSSRARSLRSSVPQTQVGNSWSPGEKAGFVKDPSIIGLDVKMTGAK